MTVNLPSWLPVPLVLFLALAGALFVYFLVGSLVRYRKGLRHFPEILPNYGCWCGALRLAAAVLTCGRCRPRRGAGAGGFADGLPRRPRARRLAFESLQSDWEDEDELEAEEAERRAQAV